MEARRAALLIFVICGGCSGVRAHERELLAHPAMQQPRWPLLQRADQHAYEVREASRGGGGPSGGGCGCN